MNSLLSHAFLTKLQFYQTYFESSISRPIAEFLAVNKSLKKLEFDGNAMKLKCNHQVTTISPRLRSFYG